MKEGKKEETKEELLPAEPAPHRVRVPGWLVQEEVGLGDLLKRVTYRAGIKPCAGCEKRATTLNRWMTVTRR
jgi:hypothetical protein